MKARNIDLTQAVGVDDAMRRIAIVRFSELLSFASALRSNRAQDLHNLRIACKRLRYAIERFTRREPQLLEPASRLGQMQESLGEWHDCHLLLGALPTGLGATRQSLIVKRDEALARSRALLRDAFARYGPFTELIRFTGLGYGFGEGEGTTEL
jgi:CHAD domain-containing protein